MRLTPSPGYLVVEPKEVKAKTGPYTLAASNDDPEKAPETGTVLEVGPLLPDKKMPYEAKFIPKKGDTILYKKYNYFTINLGVKRFTVVHFENILGVVDEQA